MNLPRILVYASGEKEAGSGGSGFQKLVEASRGGVLKAEIAAVISNNPMGGVFTKAADLKIPFRHSPKGRTPEEHQQLKEEFGAEWTVLSGFLGKLAGHDPRKTANIHPAYDLEKYGGKGFHGHHVHEAVWEDFIHGRVSYTGITMHFATANYDDPQAAFFKRVVPIAESYRNAAGLGKVVNIVEHLWQAEITNRFVQGQIYWDGVNPLSIKGADIETLPA